GWYAKVQFEEEGIGSPWVSYRQLLIDLRAYSGGTAASIGGRLATALSFGRVPPYDRVYLGYEERVRGHFFTRREGEGQALFSLEWKHVLLPLRYWDSPLPSVLLPTLKFGLNLALFADGGVVWRQGQLPWRLRWLRGCGAGLHLRLPYIEVLRLEAAVNEKGRLQAIVDIGSSF
ncbi:MAG: hypothetical protein ONB23_11920, partial [candidate division KSB1 bacterium]|nr:hypothetical protein [candidate division KSB1 bacterium]